MVVEWIGVAVLLVIILMPVYVTLGAWLFVEPRDMRTTGIGLIYMGAITVLMIVSTAALGLGFWVLANLPL